MISSLSQAETKCSARQTCKSASTNFPNNPIIKKLLNKLVPNKQSQSQAKTKVLNWLIPYQENQHQEQRTWTLGWVQSHQTMPAVFSLSHKLSVLSRAWPATFIISKRLLGRYTCLYKKKKNQKYTVKVKYRTANIEPRGPQRRVNILGPNYSNHVQC